MFGFILHHGSSFVPLHILHRCLHHLTLGRPLGDTSYANYCRCWRSQLDRFAGLQRDGSRWVQFLLPRQGPEMGFLLVTWPDQKDL